MSLGLKRIISIQKSYFVLIKDCFRDQYLKVIEANGDSKKGILNWSSGKFEDEIVYITKRRLEDIENFWKQNIVDFRDSIISLDLLPVYSVSRPLYFKRQITSAGLYYDFFISHDESISGLRNFSALPQKNLANLAVNLLRDFMDIILLESIFIPDPEIVLAIVCPSERDVNEKIESAIIDRGKYLTINYANDLLGTRFSSWEELKEKTQKIIGSQSIKKAIKKPELLPAPFNEPKHVSDRLNQCFTRLRFIQSQALHSKPDKPVMYDLLTNFLTEFGVMEGQIHGSLETDSAPLLPRYTWDLYKWRISSGNMDSSKLLGWEERRATAVVTSLQHENVNWLCNIPLNAIVELRKTGFLEDFRQRMRLVRKRLTIEEGVDFEKISREIAEDVKTAISEHEAVVDQLEHEAHERIGMETTKFVSKIWFAIASCVVPFLSLLHVIPDTVEYALKLKDNVKIMKDIPSRFRRGPWGILMEAKHKAD